MGAHLGLQNKGISKLTGFPKLSKQRNPRKPKLLQDIEFSQVYLFVIVYCTPTGKREDLWDTHVKRPKVFKCLGAYTSISLVLYLSRVLTSEKIERGDSNSI